MYCEQCQSEYPDGKESCPQCGVPLKTHALKNEMGACPSCGKAIQLTRRFCIYCSYRLTTEPRQCLECGATASTEAYFCGECGTPLTEHNPPRPQEVFQVSSGQKEARKEVFPKWLSSPALRVAVLISFLITVGFFSYRLSRYWQRTLEEELSQSLPGTPLPLPIPEGQPQPPPPSVATETPLIPPRLYRITTPTPLRDKPTWEGQEVAQLKPGMKIYVVATVGDWLKVESKSTPPKPPGYAWKEAASPE